MPAPHSKLTSSHLQCSDLRFLTAELILTLVEESSNVPPPVVESNSSSSSSSSKPPDISRASTACTGGGLGIPLEPPLGVLSALEALLAEQDVMLRSGAIQVRNLAVLASAAWAWPL